MQSSNKAGHLRGLLVLNGLLLAVLAAVTFSSSVGAQGVRGRGEYTMVTGGANGSDAGVLYIADVANQEIIAMVYNNNTRVLDGVGYRNMANDARAVAGRARPSN